MAVVRKRRSPVRSKPLVSNASAPRRARAALGVALFGLFFAFLWIVDGNWTAENSMAVLGASYLGGWGVHLLITAIQVLPALVVPWLPQRISGLVILIWLVAIPLGIFNVWSSALGISPYLLRAGMPIGVQNVVATLLGDVTAFLPEKAIGMLLLLLHRIYRG